MQFGLYGLNQNVLSEPEAAVTVAKEAEILGFDSLWVGEHVVLPDPLTPPPFMFPEEPILDPIVSLSYLAAHTNTIRLATGVIILPQRNPLVLAKELAGVDVLSHGRLIFGLGVGYLEPEMRALGVPMEHRGTRADEYLAAIMALWMQPQPSYHGKHVDFAGIQAYPRPVQMPRPPIVIGGRTPKAHRRAVRFGDGWYGFNLTVEETASQLESLRQSAQQYVRGAGLGRLEISVTPGSDISAREIRQFAELGVDRLILRLPYDGDVNRILAFVRSVAEFMMPNAPPGGLPLSPRGAETVR